MFTLLFVYRGSPNRFIRYCSLPNLSGAFVLIFKQTSRNSTGNYKSCRNIKLPFLLIIFHRTPDLFLTRQFAVKIVQTHRELALEEAQMLVIFLQDSDS